MGANFVVIVEKSKPISLEDFKNEIRKHGEFGSWIWRDAPMPDYAPWKEFAWREKSYFTWLSSPRYKFYRDLHDEEKWLSPYAITFFKMMLLIEQAAGGPIFIGNDELEEKYPCADETGYVTFRLPTELDWYRRDWRDIAIRLETKPCMIF